MSTTPPLAHAPSRIHRTTLLFGAIWTAALAGGYVLFAWQTGRFPNAAPPILTTFDGGQFVEVWGSGGPAKSNPDAPVGLMADLTLPTFLLFEREAPDPVHAIADGEVRFAGRVDGFEQVVIVAASEPTSRELIYANLDKLEIATGDSIEAGQRLGVAGAGGRLGEYLLRFEIVEGTRVMAPAAALEMSPVAGKELPELLFGQR